MYDFKDKNAIERFQMLARYSDNIDPEIGHIVSLEAVDIGDIGDPILELGSVIDVDKDAGVCTILTPCEFTIPIDKIKVVPPSDSPEMFKALYIYSTSKTEDFNNNNINTNNVNSTNIELNKVVTKPMVETALNTVGINSNFQLEMKGVSKCTLIVSESIKPEQIIHLKKILEESNNE